MDEQTALLIGICEECLDEAPLFNAILYGRSLQMCDKCAKLNGALILKKPKPEQVYNSIRPSTKDTMRRASGISIKSPEQKEKEERRQKEITMEEMRERARKLKEKKEKEKKDLEEVKKREEEILKKKQNEVLDEKEFLDYLEEQMKEIRKQEEELKKMNEKE